LLGDGQPKACAGHGLGAALVHAVEAAMERRRCGRGSGCTVSFSPPYLMALSTRLASACWMRIGSAWTRAPLPLTTKRRRFCAARAAKSSQTSSTSRRRSNSFRCFKEKIALLACGRQLFVGSGHRSGFRKSTWDSANVSTNGRISCGRQMCGTREGPNFCTSQGVCRVGGTKTVQILLVCL